MNKVEKDVQSFWGASQAWKGTLGPIEGLETVGELLGELTYLAEQPRSATLATQADALALEVVHAKRRRKKIKGNGRLINLIKYVGQKKEATKEVKAA